MKYLLLLFSTVLPIFSNAQDLIPTETEDVLVIKLINKNGGVYIGEEVVIKNSKGSTVSNGKSNSTGTYTALLPAGAEYTILIKNYPEQQLVKLPQGGFAKKTISVIYEPDAIQKQKEWALTPAQENQINTWANKLPAVTTFLSTEFSTLSGTDFQILYTLEMSNLYGTPLVGEKVCLLGLQRKKKFLAITDNKGMVRMLLPKGEKYAVNFIYDSAFSVFEVPYTLGVASRSFTLQYIGTVEIEKRKAVEAARLKEEEERIKKEKIAFEAYVAKHGITPEEGRKREMLTGIRDFTDTVILTVFNRHKEWVEKLIVCDVTGSMSPYYGQLLVWYALKYKQEKNLQFVFFNDEPNTGGIHFFPSQGYDTLVHAMSWCAAEYGGGDGPENNMEALIKGVKLAKPFKELIMIADNNAPIKDKYLIKDYKSPVHIIVCGASQGIHPDYLELAWKSGGTVHTMEEDVTKIAKLMEGESIKIGVFKYRLSGGKFYKLDEL